MADLFARLRHGVPKIVNRWQQLTDRAPWNTLSEEEWIDHLPPLLMELLSSDDDWNSRELIQQAVTHGSDRREQLFPPDAILEEYHLLRFAIWEAMSADAAAGEMLAPILAVDNRISATTLASLHALYRAEPAGAPWSDMVDELVARWEDRGLDPLGRAATRTR